MRILSISNTGFKERNPRKISAGYPNNTVQNKTYNPESIFRLYQGKDLVSFKGSEFSKTLKDNYYHLPAGCTPDAFQIEAGKALLEGKDVLVEAPTGTGKTAIAHYAASKNMAEGKTTFYTTPLKALSNQKLNEFRAVYGDENVGILTGDRRENTEAPIIIMTTEVYRNMALSNMYGEENPLMQNLGTVIFDEFHYLGDPDRGAVWEESLMYTPKDVQTLELSATIGNPGELKDWIGSLKGDNNISLVSIPPEARHVPLVFDVLSTRSYEKLEKKIAKAIKRGETPDSGGELTVKKPRSSDFKDAVEKLNQKEQLPAIFFIFSRKYSREVLEYLKKQGPDLTSAEEKEEIQKITDKYNSEKYIGSDLDIEALKKGYAIHNAGIIPGQKELIEELFQKKLLKVVIATETLAAGINMPAKTVVISSPYKPCSDSSKEGRLLDDDVKIEETEDSEEEEKTPVRLLSSNEFKQMSGRAGRRGIDTMGYVYTMPTTREAEQDFLYLEATDSNPIEANYNPDYSFLSGYYEHNRDALALDDVFDKTFFAYSKDKEVKAAKIAELKEISDRKTQILLNRGFLVNEDGAIYPELSASMASKVKGYNALTLTELINSGVLKGITPQALAMTAAAIAVPSKSSETAIGYETDLSAVFFETKEGLANLNNALYGSVTAMLAKLGKTSSSFSSYEEILDFARTIKTPEVSQEELIAAIRELGAKRAKMYKIIKQTGSYTAEELVKALLNGETVPTKVLETYLREVEQYKKKINTRTIGDYIKKLRGELAQLDTSSKGRKAELRIKRKQQALRSDITKAVNMQYLDEHIADAMALNFQFIKKNPPERVKQEYNAADNKYLKATVKEKLIATTEVLQSIRDFCDEVDIDASIDYDKRKINEVFKKLLSISAEIYSTETDNGINASDPNYNKDAARDVYIWTSLNQANTRDSLANWKQLIKMIPETIEDEGTIYRNVMQAADLLSQIGEMADAAAEQTGIDYYKELKQTAKKARELLIKEPVTV